MLHMSSGRTKKFIREEIIPLGGCVRVGNRYLVHAWAINHALSLRNIQPRPKAAYPPSRLRGLRPRQKSKLTVPPSTSSETPSTSSGEKS